MSKPILDPQFWKTRLNEADYLHQAVYRCTPQVWEGIENAHRRILANHVGEHTSVLDIGGAWGRLVDLLPKTWDGPYVCVDLSPDFIKMGRSRYPQHTFICGDLRNLAQMDLRHGQVPIERFDLAVAISIKQMVKSNLGEDQWKLIVQSVSRRANKLLVLEYEQKDVQELIDFSLPQFD